MKNALAVCAAAALALPAFTGLLACTSVEVGAVREADFVPLQLAGQHGTPIAVVQANAVGFSALFYLVDFVRADLDTVVNELLLREAKAMGGSKVVVLEASTTPRHGIFALFGAVVAFPSAHATGIVLE